ncbi:MAG: (d)CMP kinase [Bacteroidaceae bacterium]|nr:(d)CMP kinase [Bacteroidaceae bacterium]
MYKCISVCRALAKKYRYEWLNSGEIYRCMAE